MRVALLACLALSSVACGRVLKPRPPSCSQTKTEPCEQLGGFVGVNVGAASTRGDQETHRAHEYFGELFVARRHLAIGVRVGHHILAMDENHYRSIDGLLLAYVAPLRSLNVFGGLGGSTGHLGAVDNGYAREAVAWRGVLGVRQGIIPIGSAWLVGNLEVGLIRGHDDTNQSFSTATLNAGVYLSF